MKGMISFETIKVHKEYYIFIPSISTAHNKKVAEKLISEVASQPGSSFDLVAVKRK